jgi:hypothetical protein
VFWEFSLLFKNFGYMIEGFRFDIRNSIFGFRDYDLGLGFRVESSG